IRRYFIGIHSGSSLFGVDAALVRTDGIGTAMTFTLERFLHLPFTRELRELLLRVNASATPELRHLGMLHRVLGETFALAARQLLEQARLPAQQVFCIGCSGQTVWHDPDGRYPATFNLGMASVLAERSGLTTLSDFASGDLAVGGQGLPITAIVEAMLFRHRHEQRVHIHLGGTASVVSLPAFPNGHISGFQATPCGLLLDGLMRLLTSGREPFDAGGKHAVQGRCLEPLLDRWLQNHFFQQRPPKCVPRLEFADDFLNRAVEQAKRMQGNLHDVLCTMTHFVAHALVHALQTHLPKMPTRILLSGRGVRNGFLWHLLQQKLGTIPLERTDDHGVPADACQALAHAGLAALTVDGVPVNLPSVTGASGQRLLGHFNPGSSANWARCLTWMAHPSTGLQSAAA
ncbi:MAG: anhydro-N-acetylmuramic acid kinase, partial [Planctomycetes bacterium]|nr:anhydro-N-acetylmuramic acid kinase [Planctomycetota bacterium]